MFWGLFGLVFFLLQIKSKILKGNSTGKQLNPECLYHGGGCTEVPAVPPVFAAKSPRRREKGGGAREGGDGRGNELSGLASLCYASV